MLKLHTQRKIEFLTLDRPTALVVVAFVVEICGNEKNIISEPKVVKVILKQNTALASGKKQTHILALPAPISHAFSTLTPIESPFISTIFGFSNSEFIIALAARPPTIF